MEFNWAAFLSYIVLTTYTPGPNNLMSMNNAARFGLRKGFPFNLGIWSAFSLVMILCAVFSATLYAVIPRIQLPMKILGAAYMLYLAWKTLKPAARGSDREAKGGYWYGFALQFVNPKIFIYGITAMSSFILPNFSAPAQVIAFALLLAFVGFTGNMLWALFGSLFLRLFSRHSGVVKAVMTVLLVYCAVSLFL